MALGSLNFVLSMFYRVSTAVISPALVEDLGFTTSQLSDLSAVFFYAFAACQIPVGMAIDRLGPRITLAILSVAALGGAVFFALGQTPGELIAARALLGVGMSGNFMTILALLAVWFPVDRFAFVSGLVVSIGVLGNLLAATPLALLEITVGWRMSFLIFAAANAVIVTIFIVVARDRPPGAPPFDGKATSALKGLGRLIGMYSYWAISFSNFVRYGYFAALQSLWAAPFLVYGLGLSELSAGNALLCMGIGYMVGLPVFGSLSDRVVRSRKKVVLASTVVFAVITASVALWTDSIPLWTILGTFFLLGVTASPGQILYAHMKELMPTAMVAQAMTAVNLFTILGVGVVTHFLGFLIGDDSAGLRGPEAFRPIWYAGAIGLAVVAALYSRVPDSDALRG